MADFSHLSAFEVDSKTSRYVMDISMNGIRPTLIVAPATEANKPYLNALLKSSGKLKKRSAVSASTLEENREQDRKLYPQYVIKGWEDIIDSNGVEVPCTRKNAEDFLSSLPDWIFDDLRLYCGDPANHVDQLDVEVLAKN